MKLNSFFRSNQRIAQNISVCRSQKALMIQHQAETDHWICSSVCYYGFYSMLR